MDIIKRGDKKPPRYRGTCDKCGCVFEANQDELTIIPARDQRDDPGANVKCPQCGEPATMYRKQQGWQRD